MCYNVFFVLSLLYFGREAELVTIMSTRDGARLPSGLVGPSVCEMEKTGSDPEEMRG